MIRCLASLHGVLAEREFPRFLRYYQDTPIPCRSFRVTSFPSLGDTTGTHGWFRIFRRHRVSNDGPGVGHPGLLPGIASVETTGPPKFLGNPNVHLHMFFDPGRTGRSSPKRNVRTVLAKKRTKTPTRNPLSRLNSMASGLAVYASQCRLPKHHARLASGCRLRSAGQALARIGFR